MKRVLIPALVLVVLLVSSVASLPLDNYVRWNSQLGECVYFYWKGPGQRAHCFVASDQCSYRTPENEVKTIDPVECSKTPLNSPGGSRGECAVFTEGDLIVLKYEGSDPDEGVGPAGRLFYNVSPPFSEKNEWQTGRGDAGNYTVNVTVSDGEYEVSKELCFVVLSSNHPPVLSVSGVTVREGEVARLSPRCDDEDGDAVTITYEGVMTSPSWKTGYKDSGEYEVNVTCTDTDGLSDSHTVVVRVLDVNRPPKLFLTTREVVVRETETVRLKAGCTDLDGDAVTITYEGAMTRNTWKTGYEDAGEYEVNVTCTDERGASVSESAHVTVLNKNRPPRITAMVVKG